MKVDFTIPGWATRGKLIMISNMATILNETVDNPRILEIGVWAGRSMFHWAANAPRAQVVALDPSFGYTLAELKRDQPDILAWMDGDPDQWDMWDRDVEDVRKDVLLRHGLTNVDLRRDWSNGYFKDHTPDPFDFIYIDGDHDTDPVYTDITNSRNHLNPGGIICGDDYNWPTVRTAVLNYQSKFGLKLHVFKGIDMWVLYDDKEFDRWFPKVVDNFRGIR